jgi:DNA-binding NtrC family response regulator
VGAGRFRSDLYYRLNVVELALPPLRERRGDLPLLAESFLRDCARRFGKPLRGFSPRALAVLAGYDWPGNVRELLSQVEAAAAAARGETIEESDLPVRLRVAVKGGQGDLAAPASPPAQPARGPATECFARKVEEFQRALLVEALARNLWRPTETARELGLERHQLKYLCAKLGVRRTSA